MPIIRPLAPLQSVWGIDIERDRPSTCGQKVENFESADAKPESAENCFENCTVNFRVFSWASSANMLGLCLSCLWCEENEVTDRVMHTWRHPVLAQNPYKKILSSPLHSLRRDNNNWSSSLSPSSISGFSSEKARKCDEDGYFSCLDDYSQLSISKSKVLSFGCMPIFLLTHISQASLEAIKHY